MSIVHFDAEGLSIEAYENSVEKNCFFRILFKKKWRDQNCFDA